MAIPRFEEDVEVISKLGDVPGSDNGMSTQQLKKAFDAAAVKIKNYINNILLPGIDSSVNEDGLLAQISKELKKLLPLSGGTMTGAINMNGRSLYNVKTPSQDSEATPKGYVDRTINTAMGNAKTKVISKTLTASGWSDTAPYTQNISVDGLADELRATAYPVFPSALEEKIAMGDESAKIRSCTRSGKIMTFECWEEKPAIDIPIVVEVSV